MIYKNKTFTKLAGYDNYYICKETSEVLSTKERKNTHKNTIKVLKQVPNSNNPQCNYLLVTLVNSDGTRKNAFIHRLMGETFIPNPDNKPQINHIDGNKQNNNLSNLEWVTVKENAQHAVNLGLTTYDYCKVKVHQYDKNGNYIQTFNSYTDAQNITGIQYTNIRKVVNNERKSAGGYIWKKEKVDNLFESNVPLCRKVYRKPIKFGETPIKDNTEPSSLVEKV